MIVDGMEVPGSQVRVHRTGESCTVCGYKMADIYFVTPVIETRKQDDGTYHEVVVPAYWRLQRRNGAICALRRTGCVNPRCNEFVELGLATFPKEASKYMQAERDIKRSIRAASFLGKRKKRRRRR